MDLTFLTGVFASPWNIIRSLIDIFIVAYIIYRLLRLIKGTRGEQLLKGVVILLVFSVAASYMQLDMITWLLEKLWIVFAIALPIVFQPELRRLLEQLGRGSFFASSRSSGIYPPESNLYKEIIDAVTVLSRNKVGALIVVCGEDDINEHLESGVFLDSMVSSQLLISIFIPHTPLHDGAVIINQGRIERAACFLPLTKNPVLDKELGTRHRAGLGISELSDTLVIIVSEETGAISLARDGKLTPYLDAQGLKDILYEELPEKEKWQDFFKRRWWTSANGEKKSQD